MKVRVRLDSTALSAIISATARTIRRAIPSAANVSVNADGLEKLATKSARLVITVKTARRNARKICQRKRLAIT